MKKIKYYILKILHLIPFLEKKLRKKYMLADISINKDGVYSRDARKLAQRFYNVKVGKWCNGPNTFGFFNKGGSSVVIGNYSGLAMETVYYGVNHPTNYISVSAIFSNKKLSNSQAITAERFPLEIGNDVWVGTRVVITAGCKKIGNGAIVGAGSIVTKDVPPYAIVAGNPAKVIKYRFSEEEISLLEKSQWWNYSPEQIMRFYSLIDKPKEFANAIIEYKEKENSK
jgi:acetyltransferase-like isoleucine patch superfamily enzyme